tara:strand:- start:146 stop:1051 length:906 start_codon:yes stop_codon:yes gene_type:complete
MVNTYFSVVIPTYNNKDYLKKAIQSVLNQSFKEYEIIVVDNFSSDGTEKLISDMNEKKVTFVKKNNNGVIARSRNLGINQSKSKWVAFLDSDDAWYPDRLKKIYNFLKKEGDNFQVVCTDELIIDKVRGVKRVWKYGPYRNNFYENLIKFGNCISTSGSVVNRDYLLKNKIMFNENELFSPIEDYDFWMLLAKNKAKFKFINEVMGEHLFHKESYGVESYLKIQESRISILKKHIYEIQNFTKDKKILWHHVTCRLSISEIESLLHKRKFLIAFKKSVILFVKYPIKAVIHLVYRIRKKLL